MMNTYNNGTCALQFPSHYVPLTEEEMEYVDGGYYLSKQQCVGICSAIALNPVSIALTAVGISLAKKAVKTVSTAIGGFVGWAAGALIAAVVSYVSAQIITMARGVIAGAKYNGVDLSFEVNFGQNKWGVCYGARY